MTTLSCSQNASKNSLLIFLFVIGIAGMLIFLNFSQTATLIVSEHALEKHSYDAVVVDSCLQNGSGYLGEFKRDSDGRILKVCQVDTGKYGIKVQESNGNPVTDFIKEKLRRIDQVLKYVTNRGYKPHDDVAKNLYKIVFE
jgi:hypothetical protein